MRVLKIGSDWCPACLIMRHRWKEIEEEYPWLMTEYYDFDRDKDIVEKWGINSILPTFIFLDCNNNELLRLHGEILKKEIIKVVNENKER